MPAPKHPRGEKTVRISLVAWRLLREAAFHHEISIGQVVEHLAASLMPPPRRPRTPLPEVVELVPAPEAPAHEQDDPTP